MQPGQTVLVRTNAATQLTGTLAQGASLTAVLPPGSGDGRVDESLAAGRSVQGCCRSIVVVSVDNLAWEVSLWASSTFGLNGANLALYDLLGLHRFASTDGEQVNGVGPYLYYIDNLWIPVRDNLDLGQVYVMLVNRSAGGKTGAILVQLGIEPAYGR